MFTKMPSYYYFNDFCTDNTDPIYHRLFSHLKCFPFTWVWVLHFLYDRLLIDYRKLLSLADQLLFELFLCLGLQELLSEGNVGEHRRKCSAKFNRCLGAFLRRLRTKLITFNIILYSYLSPSLKADQCYHGDTLTQQLQHNFSLTHRKSTDKFWTFGSIFLSVTVIVWIKLT